MFKLLPLVKKCPSNRKQNMSKQGFFLYNYRIHALFATAVIQFFKPLNNTHVLWSDSDKNKKKTTFCFHSQLIDANFIKTIPGN